MTAHTIIQDNTGDSQAILTEKNIDYFLHRIEKLAKSYHTQNRPRLGNIPKCDYSLCLSFGMDAD